MHGALETIEPRSVQPTTVGAKSAVVATVVLSLGILALWVDILFREGDESGPTDTTGSLPMDEISEGSGCPCRVLDPRRICA